MKKRTEQLIAITISVILGILLILLVNFISPEVRIAFTEAKPTQEDYEILKEYAIKEAKGLHVNVDEEIKAYRKIEEEALKIQIETSRMYGVEASFPISEATLEIDNGTIEYRGVIDYNNATYLGYTYVRDKIEYLAMDFILVVCIAGILYIAYYILISPKLIRKE